MSFGWIDAGSYSFNALLLMDTWLVRYISDKKDAEFCRHLSVGLGGESCGLVVLLRPVSGSCRVSPRAG